MAGSYQRELRRRTLDRMAEEGADRLEVWQELDPGGFSKLIGHMVVIPPYPPFYDRLNGAFRPGSLAGREVVIARADVQPWQLQAARAFRTLFPLRHTPITARDGLWPRNVAVPLRELPRR